MKTEGSACSAGFFSFRETLNIRRSQIPVSDQRTWINIADAGRKKRMNAGQLALGVLFRFRLRRTALVFREYVLLRGIR